MIVTLAIAFEIVQSCINHNLFTIPALTTVNVTDITSFTASSGGVIRNDGGSEIISRGVCWDVAQFPTVASNRTDDGTGTSFFRSYLTGLSPNTQYYVRAYASNKVGTNYGNQVSFFTADTTRKE